MNASEVSAESKAKLRALHESNNPMALVRRIEQEKKEIERCRLLRT